MQSLMPVPTQGGLLAAEYLLHQVLTLMQGSSPGPP